MKMFFYNFFLLVSICYLMGCGPSFVMNPPEGFAHYHKEKRFLKYISSEGVRVKVSYHENVQKGNVEMWQKAIENFLLRGGYHHLYKNEITAQKNTKGIYAEYRISYNAQPFIYAVAIFVRDQNVYLIEAGGLEKSFIAQRTKIITAIQSFELD
ncbi:MAG: hypothetical protein N2316_13680 [Spirochaetes bacterium]|nr:hypothetical protein [Spirochaetota bacterium]